MTSRWRTIASVAAAVVIGATAGALYVERGGAQAEAPTVEFWVPSGTGIAAASDTLTFTAAQVGTASLDPTCGVPEPGDYPVQAVALGDPAGGSTRFAGVAVLQPVAASTRVGDLELAGTCMVDGVPYNVFVGGIQP